MDKNTHFILTILAMVLYGASILLDIQLLSVIGLLFSLYIIIKGNPSQVFSSLLSSSFFSRCVTLGNIEVFFILPLLAWVKGGMFSKDKRMPLLLIFLVIFTFYELSYSTMALYFSRVCVLLYFFQISSTIGKKQINFRSILYILMITLIYIEICTIVASGGITSFIAHNEMWNRFGEIEDQSKNVFDGAMGMPVHTVELICLLYCLLSRKNESRYIKVVFTLPILALLFVTFLTTSKVYLLGLSVFIVCFMLSSLKNIKVSMILLIIIVPLFVWFAGSEYYFLIFDKYYLRLTADDVSSGRLEIIDSCIEYLNENPLALIFGLGYDSYIEIGKRLNLMFQMSAHNTLLDGIMAYGLFGLFLMISSLRHLYGELKMKYKNSFNIQSWMPAICWLAMSMTNSSFMLQKTYFLLLFFVIYSQCNNIKLKYQNI